MNKNKAKWKKVLEDKILHSFPMPWASHGIDVKFENYIKNALRHLDGLKSPQNSNRVYLGEPVIRISDRDSLQACRISTTFPEKGESLNDVTKGLVDFFHGMMDWGHPKMGMNVVPPSTLPSIAANLMAAVFSPNLIEQEYSVNVAAAEIEAVAMCAGLAGFDPDRAGGIFTFGGLGTWLYAMKIGLTKALGQQSRFKGVRDDAVVICSEVSHFSKLNCSDWLGLGMDQVRTVGINDDNSMDLDHLKDILDETHNRDLSVALICGTMGTTDAFGVDDIGRIASVRDAFVQKYNLDYRPHIHADAVIGWAWMVFRDYDFTNNPLEFSAELLNDIRTVASKFRNISRADSIGFDFHKTGYTPYISSLIVLKEAGDFDLIRRPAEKEAYLFHFGAYNPGEYSLESSRSAAGALAAWANLKLFGLEGFRVILAQLVEAERILRRRIEALPDMVIVNPDDHGFVSLYRVYPPEVKAASMYRDELNGKRDEDLIRHNTYLYNVSTEINRLQREENGPFLSFTSNHRVNVKGTPVAALKVFPMSPFVNESTIDLILEGILAAKRNVDRTR